MNRQGQTIFLVYDHAFAVFLCMSSGVADHLLSYEYSPVPISHVRSFSV